VIVPDLNLLVYAYNADAPMHSAAYRWWNALVNGRQTVGIAWVVTIGFVRLMTSRVVLAHPMPATSALAQVKAWYTRPNVVVLEPGPRHLEIFEQLVTPIGTAGNLATDAHLAALAIEHQCELHSNDRDFERFSGLRWRNPI
jgi:toxin-antitoxin system PIN domain toxin